MGYNIKDGLTGDAINTGDKIGLIILKKSFRPTLSRMHSDINDLWYPVSLPIFGERGYYNDIVSVKEDSNTAILEKKFGLPLKELLELVSTVSDYDEDGKFKDYACFYFAESNLEFIRNKKIPFWAEEDFEETKSKIKKYIFDIQEKVDNEEDEGSKNFHIGRFNSSNELFSWAMYEDILFPYHKSIIKFIKKEEEMPEEFLNSFATFSKIINFMSYFKIMCFPSGYKVDLDNKIDFEIEWKNFQSKKLFDLKTENIKECYGHFIKEDLIKNTVELQYIIETIEDNEDMLLIIRGGEFHDIVLKAIYNEESEGNNLNFFDMENKPFDLYNVEFDIVHFWDY